MITVMSGRLIFEDLREVMFQEGLLAEDRDVSFRRITVGDQVVQKRPLQFMVGCKKGDCHNKIKDTRLRQPVCRPRSSCG